MVFFALKFLKKSAVSLLLYPTVATAQDTSFVQPVKDFVTLKLALSSEIENFSVHSANTYYQINPNTATVASFSLNYSFLSVSAKFSPSFFPGNADTEEKGKTSSRGLSLNLNFEHWLQELAYTRTNGYYLYNTSDYQPGWQEGDAYIQFPDLLFKSVQGVTGYKLNRNFSFNALATQSERQLKSAGSFVPQFLYRYYITDDRTPLVGSNQSSQKSRNLELLLGAGYYHNFVIRKNVYIALGLTPGAGILFMNLTTRAFDGSTIHSRQRDFIFRADARAGLAYNGERFFGGLYATAFTASYEQDNSQVINGNARLFYKIFLGYRIPAPSLLKEKVNYIKNKLIHTKKQS
ncbi:DUF4421 family protein [Flavihumibacter sp. CACIAM 22H1]|uniref:DUF4421 family protein n=1 Tax=Flavihumibacter sp. CACIAM 22H1 TaxID=1812911 RepID=UPI0007A90585|nr:DUF4421 family protein [Flavihumibacter sp. CACIAM 22H1]KYP16538.1 MAG: hypothetical protein A1D16_13795 [Flavihumibacter sp. CACIAM 22H1]